jgi:hypothetical protein
VIGRGRYAVVGAALVVTKYGLDRALAAAFHRSWGYVDYWVPSSYALDELPHGQRWFFFSLLVLRHVKALAETDCGRPPRAPAIGRQ